MGRKKEKGFWDSLGSSVDNVFSSVGELASDAFDEANKFAKKTTNNATNFLDSASLVAGDIAEDIYKDASKQFKKTSKDVSKVFDKTMKVGTSIADSVIDSTVPVIKETVGAAKGFIIVVFDVFVGMLTRVAVRREVKQKCPDAFKVMIRKKKINAVNVGIFDNKSHLIADNVEMKATEGVADEIKVGQTIYL